MVPALLGVSVAQISLLINTQIASHLGAGAVSWLNYADRLMEFPTALLGVALGVVLMPQLAAAQGRERRRRLFGDARLGPAPGVLLALPCAVALLVFPEPLVAVLFHTARSAPTTSPRRRCALMGYGVGLLGIVGVKVLAPGFYARQDMRTPVRIAIVVLVLTQVLNLALRALARPRRPGAVDRPGRAGQRRSGCSSACCAAASYRPMPGWGRFALQVVVGDAARWAPCSRWAAAASTGSACRPRRPAHGLLAACLAGAAVVYFGVLSWRSACSCATSCGASERASGRAPDASRAEALNCIRMTGSAAPSRADRARVFRLAGGRRREPSRCSRRPIASPRTSIPRSTCRRCWPTSTRWPRA